MSAVDRQRVAAVRMLEALGYRFRDGEWTGFVAVGVLAIAPVADAMHSLLVERADALIGCCTDGSVDHDELEAIGEAIEAYEAVRWPDGKIDDGKG